MEQKKMSLEQIFATQKKIIDDIYENYLYLNLSKEEYYLEVKKMLLASLKEQVSSYEEYLNTKISAYMLEKSKKLIQEDAFYIINRYITFEFRKTKSYRDAMAKFNKLNAFLEKVEYEPTLDVVDRLLNESILFNKMTGSIYRHYYTEIKEAGVTHLFKNKLLCLALNDYTVYNAKEDLRGNLDFESIDVYMKEIGDIPLLTKAEEESLMARIKEHDLEARNEFVKRNLKLVVSVARNYTNLGLSLEDLIQEGNMGLINATEKYDISKGFRFSVYAVYWIKQAIIRALNNKIRNIRLPVYMCNRLEKFKKVFQDLEVKLNREPSIAELANEMHLSIKDIKELIRLTSDTISTNRKMDNGEGAEFETIIASNDALTEDKVIEELFKKDMQSLLEAPFFTENERKVLILRFGFIHDKIYSYVEISKMFHVTFERIRQIEANALKKIRNSPYLKSLASYMPYPEDALQKAYKLKEENIKKNKKGKETSLSKIEEHYFYSNFPNYTKEQIDEATNKLSSKEQNLLFLGYGPTFENALSPSLNTRSRNKIIKDIEPKIEKTLRELNHPYSSKTLYLDSPFLNASAKTLYLKSKKLLTINNLLEMPIIEKMSETFTLEEAMIVALKFGYINNQKFLTSDIAKFLGMTPDEVGNVLKKVTTLYPKNIKTYTEEAKLIRYK